MIDPSNPPSVLLAGGGTAGHVNPLLAVADAIRDRHPDSSIIAAGTAEGLEADLVPARGYELAIIPKVPMPRRPSLDLLKLPVRMKKAISVVNDVMDRQGTEAVVGFGGYVSTPVYLAAHRRGVPLIVHEANSRPGLANKIGVRYARNVAITFPGTELKGARLVGMPLRREIVAAMNAGPLHSDEFAKFGFQDRDRPVLLVTGGSLGAQRLNESFASAGTALVDAGINVVHVTGRGKFNEVLAATKHLGGNYHVVEYLTDMATAYRLAQLVVCRSGAATVAEVTALGLPAIFVPLPIGNGEQRLNASGAVEAGGAILLEDRDLTQAWIETNLPPLLNDGQRLAVMAQAMRSTSKPGAAQEMVDLIDQAVQSKRVQGQGEVR